MTSNVLVYISFFHRLKSLQITCFDENDLFNLHLTYEPKEGIGIGPNLIMLSIRPFPQRSIHVFSFFLAITVDEIMSNMYLDQYRKLGTFDSI